MGRYVENIECPKCGAGHGLAVYQDDDRGFNGSCFKCHTYFSDPYDGRVGTDKVRIDPTNYKRGLDWIEANTTVISSKYRGILPEIFEDYGVRCSFDEMTGDISALYFPQTKGGKISGYQEKTAEKVIRSIGDTKDCELFGQSRAGNGGKMVVITEGHEDCLSSYQMFKQAGKNYRVLSLPNGASSKAVQRNLEWLDKFESIILSLDMDEPGQKAATDISELFRPGKVKIMKYSEKDANAMLQEGKAKEYFQALYNANEYRPDGIIAGKDTWDRLVNRPRVESVPYPAVMEELNKMTYGMRVGELDTWTSGSGMGKTQIVREIEYHLHETTQDNIGVIALEEPLEDSAEALMGLYLNKRIHLPDIRETISNEDYRQAWEHLYGKDRFFFYDHFGSVDEDSLLSKIRFLVNGCGCKYIILDHLSIVISEFAADGGERERIDTVMSKLKKLTQELQCYIGLIVHLRKTSGGKSFEEGGVPTLDDLRGSGSIKQLSNNVYALSRNQQDQNPVVRNTSQLHVLKCRFTGRTGPADMLYYNENTGRMVKAEPIEAPFDDNDRDEEF